MKQAECSQGHHQKASLPKGVVRGCLNCRNCQKVLGTWKPEKGCRPILDEAPIFHPNEEEFKDTLRYIASIRSIAEPYGICRIVPPNSWKPPCPLRDKYKWQNCLFKTRVQQIHKLQIREASSLNVDLTRLKRRRISRMSTILEAETELYNTASEPSVVKDMSGFGFDSGPEFTLEMFQKYADEFKDEYFSIQKSEPVSESIHLKDLQHRWKPSIENIEGEYWRIIENPTEQIEVLYGTDIETSNFGSGFPKANKEKTMESSHPYVESGWNLNNIGKLPGSVLSFEEESISGVVVPWLYIGMCFSSFCWHVEDHHFYSLNYLHWGAPKIWYGTPGSTATDFEQGMKKHLPHLFEEQPDLLQKLVTQLSPTLLKMEGLPVYRCMQQAGEFVLTLPRAYHAGFNCGFNCAEAVNVAPVDWLPYGERAVQIYRQLCRRSTVSHDKLLLGATREAVKVLWEFLVLKKFSKVGWHGFCGRDGVLTKALRARVEEERKRQSLIKSSLNRKRMDKSFDVVKERECIVCCYDLYLSAVGCTCSSERFACIEHSNKLCSCPIGSLFLLYRYDFDEFDTLIEALEGNQSFIQKWASFKDSFNLKEDYNGPDSFDFKFTKSSSPPKATTSLREAGKLHAFETTNQDAIPQTVAKDVAAHTETIVLSDDEDEFLQKCKEEKEPKSVCHGNSACADSTNCKMTKNSVSSEEIVLDEHTKLRMSYEDNDAVLGYDVRNPDFLPKGTDQIPPIKNEVTNETERMLMSDQYGRSSNPKESMQMGLSVVKESSGSHRTHFDPRSVQASISGMAHMDNAPRFDFGSSNSFDNQMGCHVSSLHPSMNASIEVELLNIGTLNFSEHWHDSTYIFPKGFKSRVSYYNIFNPLQNCNYISEILDAGIGRPLFKVTMEDCPDEMFAHISLQKCWELVLEKLNSEILKQRSSATVNVSNLSVTVNIDGFQMFGLKSHKIIEKIELLDSNRQCVQYWVSRGCRIQEGVQKDEEDLVKEKKIDSGLPADSISSSERWSTQMNNVTYAEGDHAHNELSRGISVVLDGLFKRATPHELWTLHKVMSSELWGPRWKEAFKVLSEHLKRL